MEGIIKFWEVAKTHPLNAICMLLLLVVATIGGEVIVNAVHDWWADWWNKGPFESASGLYQGRIENHDFDLCLRKDGSHVSGSMSWKSDQNNYYWVDYDGSIGKQQMDFTYSRNKGHPNPDQGKAVITPPDKDGFYGGYFKSDVSSNREEWKLKKTGTQCLLVGWTPVGSSW